MERDLALKKILHYCNYQERSKREIYEKLASFELALPDKEFIIDFLQEEGFINDERYCRTYVRSKLNQKKWGVNKIRMSLMAKGIDRDIIDDVLLDIDKDLYKEDLVNLLKNKKINELDPYKRQSKLMRYAVGKGYSIADVTEALKTLKDKGE